MSFDEAAKVLNKAKKVVILTGAGVSKESGLDTFRDAKGDGLWSQYNPMELATPQAFQRDPDLVWNWYNFRRDKAFEARPNPGHEIIAAWEKKFDEFLLVTQNVDGLHQRAGSKKVICLHGNLLQVRCLKSGKTLTKEEPFESVPPYCQCGSMLRPDIVWFGEALPEGAMEKSLDATLEADVLLVAGTSLQVYPAASLVPYALQRGIPVIEVNVEQSDFSSKTCFLSGPSGEVLPKLDSLLS